MPQQAPRVLFVVPDISTEASGPSLTVPMLCRATNSYGAVTELHVLGNVPSRHSDLNVVSHQRNLPFLPLGLSRSMKEALKKRSHQFDIVHNNGLWLMPNIYSGNAAFTANAKLIFAPRGTFSDWAWQRSRIRKSIFWNLLQKKICSRVSIWHATSESEMRDIRRRGFRQPVAVIPNGIDVSSIPLQRKQPCVRTVLYLGRIHPVKGLEHLLNAWSQLEETFPDWQLEIAGPDSDSYLPSLKKLSAERKLRRCLFSGPVYGEDKRLKYRNACIYVLPSYSENFAMTVAESLAEGTPVITTRGTPWQGINSHSCGDWINLSVEELAGALQKLMCLSDSERDEMGRRGRKWMQDDFSWSSVGERFFTLCSWLIDGGTTPDFVYLK